MFVRVTTLALFLLLGACSWIQPSTTTEQVPALQGSAPERWQLDGKIGIRYPQHLDSAGIRWQQQDDEYRITLSGPFGQGAQLHGMSGFAELKMANKEYRSRSPESLMQQVFGWHLPVSMARYWVLGRTDPDYPVSPLDDDDKAVGFHQLGWKIRVLSTMRVKSGLTLPRKIVVSRKDLSITVVVKNWQLL